MTNIQYILVMGAIIFLMGPAIGLLTSSVVGISKKEGIVISMVLVCLMVPFMIAYFYVAFPIYGIDRNAPAFGPEPIQHTAD